AAESPLGEAARAVLADVSSPSDAAKPPPSDWLRKALDAVGPVKAPPAFAAAPEALPPLPGVDAADVPRVTSALAASTPTGPHPLVAALRRHGDRPALAAFAWRLFENWLSAGAPPKEKWAFQALGHFGGDAEVLRLTPLIRAWPGEGQHQRAVVGLDVLRGI